MNHKQLKAHLKELGIVNAVAEPLTTEGYPAFILRKDGKEEIYTGFDLEDEEYQNYLKETYSD